MTEDIYRRRLERLLRLIHLGSPAAVIEREVELLEEDLPDELHGVLREMVACVCEDFPRS